MASSTTSKVIRWVLYLLIAGVIIAFIITRIIGTKQESKYETVTVTPQTITQNVEVSGTTEAEERYKLQFLSSGTLDSIFVEKGETVKAGMALAMLDNGDAKLQLQAQKSALKIVQANLAKALQGPRQEQKKLDQLKIETANIDLSHASIAEKNLLDLARKNIDLTTLGLEHAQNSYDQAQRNLDFARNSYDNELNQAQVSLDNAQIGVNQSRQDLEYTISSGYQGIVQSQASFVPNFHGFLQSVQGILQTINTVVGGTHPSIFEGKSTGSNIQKLQDAKTQYVRTSDQVQLYRDAIRNLNNPPTQYQTNDGFQKAQTVYSSLNETFMTTKDFVRSIPNQDAETVQLISQYLTQLDASYQGYQQNYQALLQNYHAIETQTDKSSYSTISSTSAAQLKNNNQTSSGLQYVQTELVGEKKIDDAQSALEQSRTNLAEAQENFNKAVLEYNRQADELHVNRLKADLNLQAAREQYKLSNAPQRDIDIEPLKAQVDQAWDGVHLAEYRLEQTKLKAPADGVISDITSREGENINPVQPLITLDATGYSIKALVSEADINKLKIENPVTITFDALGTDQSFDGAVKQIAPAETVVQGVIYYEVKISFDPKGQNIKPGMTANLTIETAFKPETLAIPTRAIQYENNQAFVQVLKKDEKGNETVEKRSVTTGLESDQTIEILSGLQEGEEVITLTKEV